MYGRECTATSVRTPRASTIGSAVSVATVITEAMIRWTLMVERRRRLDSRYPDQDSIEHATIALPLHVAVPFFGALNRTSAIPAIDTTPNESALAMSRSL